MSREPKEATAMERLPLTEFERLLRTLSSLGLLAEVEESQPPRPRSAVTETVWELLGDNQTVLYRWSRVRDAQTDIRAATMSFVQLTQNAAGAASEEEDFWIALMEAIGGQCEICDLTLSDTATLAALVLWERGEHEEERRRWAR